MEFFFQYLDNINMNELKSMNKKQIIELIDSYNISNNYHSFIKNINVEIKIINERIENLHYKYNKLIEEKWINIETKKQKMDYLDYYNLDGDDIEYDIITDDISDNIMKFTELIEMLEYILNIVKEFI
jgi:hypothetical protein